MEVRNFDCACPENIHTFPKEGIGISWVSVGFCKTQKFKEMCEALLEFSEGWRGRGVVKKIPSVGEVWIFSGTPQFAKIREYYLRLLHALVDGVEYEIL